MVVPIDPKTLTAKDKKKLEATNLIKENIDGRIKRRMCTDISKQGGYLKEGEQVASQTVLLESICTTLVIYAYEGRDVSNFGVPGAYL